VKPLSDTEIRVFVGGREHDTRTVGGEQQKLKGGRTERKGDWKSRGDRK